MTTRDEVVTTRREAVTTGAARVATTDLGEAMAPASKQRSFRVTFGAGAALLCALLACGDDASPVATAPAANAAGRAAADPALGATTVLDGAGAAFGDAVLAELTGDEAQARAQFEHVLGGGSDVPPQLTARAALHLAQIELRAGQSRRALDLAARARAVAPGDKVIEDGVGTIQAEFVDSAGSGDVRGPGIGTPLQGVTPDVAEAFAKAEAGLAQVHRRRLQLLFGETQRSIDIRINATANVVALYRAVAASGGVALVAATYRIGTLYHDLALDLSVAEPPAELMRDPARGLRVMLSNLAFTYLRKAETEYRACMDAPQSPEGELWRLAAQTYRRSVVDVLVARGVRITDR